MYIPSASRPYPPKSNNPCVADIADTHTHIHTHRTLVDNRRKIVCSTFSRVLKCEPQARIALRTAFEVVASVGGIYLIVIANVGKVKRSPVEDLLERLIILEFLKRSLE